ncbi:hypothetical protein AB4344_07845, partial [Vibrio breoganii]
MTKIESMHKEILAYSKNISSAIEAGVSHEDVEAKFKEFLDQIIRIGTYNHKTWNIRWTSDLWKFLADLSSYERVSGLVCIVEEKLKESSSTEIEVLEFIRIELMWGCVAQSRMLRADIERLVNKYPYNMEFIHTLANVLIGIDDEKFTAIKLYRQCIEAWGKEYSKIVKNTYNYEMHFFKQALESGDYLNADKQIDYIKSFQPYKDNPFFNNNSILYFERLKDRKHTEAIASKIEREVKESVKSEYENQNKKNLENLGVFSAIITFIITAAASAFNSDKSDTPLILLSIGLILILFMSTVMLFNDKPKNIFIDFRFYILLLFLGTTLYTVFSYESSMLMLDKHQASQHAEPQPQPQ